MKNKEKEETYTFVIPGRIYTCAMCGKRIGSAQVVYYADKCFCSKKCKENYIQKTKTETLIISISGIIFLILTNAIILLLLIKAV